MIIRKAKVNDITKLSILDKKAQKEMKTWFSQSEDNFKKSIKKENFYFLIGINEGKSIGYLESEYDKKKDSVWIKNIYVLKEYRKKGIAKIFIRKCYQYWKNKTDLIVLLTADRSLNIFEKLGFKKTMNYMVKVIK